MRALVLCFWLLAGGASLAQEAQQQPPNVLDRVYACSGIADDEDRLACFDSAVGRLRQAERQGEFAAVDRARAEEVQRESFGFALPSASRLLPRPETSDNDDGPVERVQLTVARVVERANGFHAFVMTNGQVWAQVQAERASNVRPGTNVTVRRGIVGSYMLSSERGGSAHRVRREQ